MPLDEAFEFLEQQDYERVPVVEGTKLLGVLSRSAIQRRLAEDEPNRVSDTEGRRTAVRHVSTGGERGGNLRDERLQRVAEAFPDLVADEPAVVVELLAGVADGELGLGDAGAHRAQHLPQLRSGPDASEGACARADHGDGLVPERVRREGPRGPVERILERARDRRVELGCREEDRVRVADELAERLDRLRPRVDVVVGVVRRDRLEPAPQRDLDARRRVLAQGAKQGRVVRAAPEGAADGEDAHLYASVDSACDERQLGLQGDVVRECRLAVRERHVPVDVERGAVDGGLEAEPEPVRAEVVDGGAGRGAGQLRGLCDALDRDLAVDLDGVAVAPDRRAR